MIAQGVVNGEGYVNVGAALGMSSVRGKHFLLFSLRMEGICRS